MAVPSITKHLDVYEGKNIECAAVNIVDATDTELVLQDIAPINGNYVFQMVAKTNSGSNSLDISVGDKSDTIAITDSFVRYILKFEDVNISNSQDLKIVFSNTDIVYLQNLQLERATQASEWRPAPEDAVDEAVEESEVKAKAIVDAQTQLDIFNKLTNNGSVKGIYLAGGELYMNASYIRSGTISADRIAAGVVTISKLANDVSSVASSDEQLIYISKASGTTSVSAPTSYITDISGSQNTWTTKRPQYDSSYPVLFIAKQKKSLNGSITCTTPQIDQTTTVIDGGHITTGTIDASVVTVSNLNASNITSGTLSASKINGGTLTLGGQNNTNGSISMLDASGNSIGSWNNSGITATSGQIAGWNIGSRVLSRTGTYWWYGVKYPSQYIGDGPRASTTSLENGFSVRDDMTALVISPNYEYFFIRFETKKVGAIGANDPVYRVGAIGIMNGGMNNLDEYGRLEINATSQLYIKVGSEPIFVHTSSSRKCRMQAGLVEINGALTVTGTKSRVVDTSDYSQRKLYCYESASPMFGDVGEGIIGEDGLSYIWFDPIFAQTVNTSQYQVFLQKYGAGDIWVKERKADHFVIEGTPGMSFGWEIKAKQSDFDQIRLENQDQFAVPTERYAEEAAEYVNTLKEGRLLK